ncbi:MAG: hypothetical protein PHX21_02810 [bacterium]|nr:hypothetical protein [bacterium]
MDDSISRSRMKTYMPTITGKDASLSQVNNLASTFVERLEKWIREAENSLKPDERLVLKVILHNDREHQVSNVSYQNPNLIAFHCIDDLVTEKTILVHQSSVQLVYSIEKIDRDTEKEQIGFIHQA